MEEDRGLSTSAMRAPSSSSSPWEESHAHLSGKRVTFSSTTRDRSSSLPEGHVRRGELGEGDADVENDTLSSTARFHRDAPADRGSFAYLIFVLLGAGLLFPWNAFISAPDYFKEKYDKNIEFWFSIAYTVPNLMGLLVMIKFGRYFSFTGKTFLWFTISLLILIFVPIVPSFNIVTRTATALVLTLVFITGMGTAVLQGSMFGFAAQLPSIYSQALMGGNGIAGVIVSILRIITKASIPDSDSASSNNLSGLIYFLLSGSVVFLCIVFFIVLLRLPFTRYYVTHDPSDSIYEAPLEVDAYGDVDDDSLKDVGNILTQSAGFDSSIPRTSTEEDLLYGDGLSSGQTFSSPFNSSREQSRTSRPVPSHSLPEISPPDENSPIVGIRTGVSSFRSPVSNQKYGTASATIRQSRSSLSSQSSALRPDIVIEYDNRKRQYSDVDPSACEKSALLGVQSGDIKPWQNPSFPEDDEPELDRMEVIEASALEILKKRWVVAFGVFYTFFVSLSIFPGLATSIPRDEDTAVGRWFDVIIVTIFNVFDTIGRLAPGRFRIFSEKTFIYPVLLRSVFFILFAFCIRPLIFTSPYIPFVLMAFMALTNGFFGSLCMMYGPEGVKQYEKGLTGTIMTGFLLAGITCGSFFGIGLNSILS